MPSANLTTQQVFKQSMKLMGNQFEISVVANNLAFADEKTQLAVTEIKRIEQLLTTFKPDSQTNKINENAGIAPVKVDTEVFHLIQRSIRISEISQGAFDITYGSLDKRFWNFDTQMESLPDKESAKKSVSLINYKNVVLDLKAQTVFLKEKGMRIGFGGIGKGYAADRAKRILQEAGVESGIVNASGDLSTWGTQPSGKPWTVGIADPEHKSNPFSFMDISNMAIATSGNYEKFAVINGKKYSHTIDPHTGFPVSGIKSVSIICPQAELADALATPVMVMGVEVGLNLINQLSNIACIIIDDYNQLHTSKNININPTKGQLNYA
ncbi:thiamine biosynthesis protein ApbE [Pedobacter psychrophilus]|uniref:FAD:protein FMN transferase n=1 Tax=Pedobacter psychrophilus TaxID=1826909 RepID=A0A179DD41_9SPHI|nr:FAD:protein FMN transferase [Pedobacter psychrophilus]OAQ38888.1 thiamine biosynthesis protein ApbE [Pedobacter psychrophilus]